MKDNSERKQHEEAIELGKNNVDCINGIRGWCKHARVEMKFAGLYAEMTGLPIGMVEVTCQLRGQWVRLHELTVVSARVHPEELCWLQIT